MKNLKGLFFVLAFGLVLLASAFTVLADSWTEDSVDISKATVYVNGDIAWRGSCVADGDDFSCTTTQYAIMAPERDSQVSVRIVFKAAEDLSNLKVSTWINGYREEIEDRTGEFDVFEGNQYTKTMLLTLPEDFDARDAYTLYVQIESKKSLHGIDKAEIDLNAQRIANKLDILSVTPWSQTTGKLNAGATMYTDVVVKNIGNHLSEDCYVKVSIPELNLERTVYVGDIGSHDNSYEDAVKTTVSMKLPEDAAGNYKLVVKAYNSQISAETSKLIAVNGIEKQDTTDNTDNETDETHFGWENVLMIISIVLAVAIIVLLVLMLVKQKPCKCEEKPETDAESYY